MKLLKGGHWNGDTGKNFMTEALGPKNEVGDFTDVTLVFKDGTQVRAHKLILALNDFFKDLLINSPESDIIVFPFEGDLDFLPFIYEDEEETTEKVSKEETTTKTTKKVSQNNETSTKKV